MTSSERGEPARRPESFDDAAADYDAFRPPYPPGVVRRVLAAGRVAPSSRVLEVACGTGQLSVDVAKTGCELVAVEMGPNLAGLARKKLEPYPRSRVEVSRFETWPVPTAKFDSVMCATAFHWLDPKIRFAKSAQCLRPGGFLVVLHVHHVRGGTPGFFEDTQPYYLQWGLSRDPGFQLPTATSLPPMYPELDRCGEFRPVRRERLEVPRASPASSYVGMLRTDSLVLTLDPEARQGFLESIGRLIESKYGGSVVRNFVYEVVTAQRV